MAAARSLAAALSTEELGRIPNTALSTLLPPAWKKCPFCTSAVFIYRASYSKCHGNTSFGETHDHDKSTYAEFGGVYMCNWHTKGHKVYLRIVELAMTSRGDTLVSFRVQPSVNEWTHSVVR